MAAQQENPSYYQLVGAGPKEIHEKEHAFELYMFQILEGQPGGNQKIVVNPNQAWSFGCITTVDWILCDGPDRNRDKIVARVQGMKVASSTSRYSYFLTADILFTDERFKESSLKMVGSFRNQEDGELAIVGGSGEFSYAQGAFNYKETEFVPAQRIARKVDIRIFSRNTVKLPPVPTPPTKVGPLGGNGGDVVDIPPAPQRLESVTIGSGDVIDSLAFSYIDQVGEKQTAGPWGGDGGLSKTINFEPTETVKKIMGTTGNFGGKVVVNSLKIVTNLDTYGPYGKGNGIQFVIPENDNSSVVGFHGRAGLFLDAIGIYATEN